MTEAPVVTIVELTNSTGFPRRFTCAAATAISKGILLQYADARTAAAGNTKAAAFAGVAAMDKDATDGSTSISVYTDCVIDVRASGAITAGEAVCLAGLNEVMRLATATTSQAMFTTQACVGYALETATDQEIINVRVKA